MCSCLHFFHVNITDTRRETKYLDLFVWDSTIAMSEEREGEMETAMMLLPVHRATHLTFSKRCLPLLANRLCNISLANFRDRHPGLRLFKSYKNTSFLFLQGLKRQGERKLNWHFELQKGREGEGAADTAVVIQVKLPATCRENIHTIM